MVTSPRQSKTLWTEEGDVRVGPVATVAPLLPIDRTYTYAIPDELSGCIEPGRRVMVPVGAKGRPILAFCIETGVEQWTSALKFVQSAVDERSYLPGRLVDLARWMARYYCCPLGRTMAAMVPAPVRQQAGFRAVRYVQPLQRVAQIIEENKRLGAKQKSVLAVLVDDAEPVSADRVLRQSGASMASLRTLAARGFVEILTRREPRPAPDFDAPPAEPDFELNAEQKSAVNRCHDVIAARAFRALLLFGVSGSGKTEVYINAMRKVVSDGRQALMLVPEIALTTQLMQRLAKRFRDIAIIHSALTGVQRSLLWNEIAAGRKRVIIGTRSAVFAPCPELGLIVVDEEQESSFKNLQAPRYNSRDVGIKRAQLENVPIILGTATPSLETWHNCRRFEHYELIRLHNRVAGLPMPAVRIVDMHNEQFGGGRQVILSRVLVNALRETLDQHQQAILLLNRRGYASVLICRACKRRIECPNCQANAVFHKAGDVMICHYCHRRFTPPKRCPMADCRQPLIRIGIGTQRLEEVLAGLLPTARVLRADSDAVSRPEHYARIVSKLENHEIDILIGTQMIAKGLDFPFVSLVGVINADTAMAIPDFRAAERTFQLVTQVAGRAGRADKPGRVVVQTIMPDSYAIQAAMRHDFEAFAAEELPRRQVSGYPPFGRLARIVISDPVDSKARQAAEDLSRRIDRTTVELHHSPMTVSPALPCFMERLRNQYRYEVLIRASSASDLQTLLDHLRGAKALAVKAKTLTIDVDPISLL